MPPWIFRICTYQIDTSMIDNSNVSGLGWSFKDQISSNLSDYGRATEASQPYMLRWKVYYGQLHA